MIDRAGGYSADELTAVARMFGTPSFPNVDAAVFAGLEADAIEAALRSARRSLLARGVVEIDDAGALRVAPPHSILFRVALAPAAIVNAELRRPEAAESRSYYALPAVAVEHACAIGHVHSLTQFEPAQLFDRVIDFLELVERPSGDAAEVELDVADLNRALAGEKVEDSPFGQALGGLRSTAFVRSLSRPNGTLVGGELRWIDTGEGGLWLVEPSEGDAGRAHVRRTEAGELLDALLSYLPGGDRQPAT